MNRSESTDPLELDAMLEGGGDEASWVSLLTAGDGAAAWAKATARRARMDRFAEVVIGRPWLARALLAIRRTRRRWAATWDAPLIATLERDPLLATLDGDVATLRQVEVSPGDVRVEEVALAHHVALRLPPHTHALYLASDGWHDLPSARWRMEPGDAPVVLAAVLDEDALGSAAAPAPEARVIATLVLIEPVVGETTR